MDDAPNRVKRVLMVAYHFPPLAGSSGIQRTLRFVQHLPRFGWQALVLTTKTLAYGRTAPDLDREVPAGTVVRRAMALDTSRHLSWRGRYLGALARPDRWMSWKYDALRQGLQMIEQHRPELIWSTHPIATAHLIGAELQHRSGLPWVADFRDPMTGPGLPADPKTWSVCREVERTAMHRAALSVFTAPGAAQEYRDRYPEAADRVVVIENGFDEESFADVEADAVEEPLNPGAITLLHSGIIYPDMRDPTQLFIAMARLKSSGVLQPGRFVLRFRAPVHDSHIADLVRAHDLAALVEILPPVGYKDALKEILRADALLVLQASACNAQIPAKIYEYLRARRPILGLTDPGGDTAAVMRQAGLSSIAQLTSADEIANLLCHLLDGDLAGQLPGHEDVAAASRLGRSRTLAGCFDLLLAGRQAGNNRSPEQHPTQHHEWQPPAAATCARRRRSGPC